MYEKEFVSLESCTYTMTSARSVFFGFRRVSASYLEPNSCSYKRHTAPQHLQGSAEGYVTRTTRYFSDPSISTEFTTLFIFFVGSYTGLNGLPANARRSDVFPDPAAPQK